VEKKAGGFLIFGLHCSTYKLWLF